MASSLTIALSELKDGSMSKGVSDDVRLVNRAAFLAKQGIVPERTALVHLTYGGDDYRRFFTVNKDTMGDGIVRPATLDADALFTTEKELAFLLPIADCIAAVLHDTANSVLGLAHLGRHNLEQQAGTGVIDYMVREFGSHAEDIQVWLSPAAGKINYPLYAFNNRSLHEVAVEQLAAAGVVSENIQIDSRDTTTDEALFSHSEFLKGNRELDGRQAVVCMMK